MGFHKSYCYFPPMFEATLLGQQRDRYMKKMVERMKWYKKLFNSLSNDLYIISALLEWFKHGLHCNNAITRLIHIPA